MEIVKVKKSADFQGFFSPQLYWLKSPMQTEVFSTLNFSFFTSSGDNYANFRDKTQKNVETAKRIFHTLNQNEQNSSWVLGLHYQPMKIENMLQQANKKSVTVFSNTPKTHLQ